MCARTFFSAVLSCSLLTTNARLIIVALSPKKTWLCFGMSSSGERSSTWGILPMASRLSKNWLLTIFDQPLLAARRSERVWGLGYPCGHLCRWRWKIIFECSPGQGRWSTSILGGRCCGVLPQTAADFVWKSSNQSCMSVFVNFQTQRMPATTRFFEEIPRDQNFR